MQWVVENLQGGGGEEEEDQEEEEEEEEEVREGWGKERRHANRKQQG
jgi:hypothetical protein